jgi:ABC-type lipoprotein export system ATPase subunit
MLKISGIKKNYRIAGESRAVLDGIDLEVKAGEIVAIAGTSGCGKTTLLNVIAGLTGPDSGRVYINGRRVIYFLDIFSSRIRNRGIGFIFQTFRLLNEETVMANVLLPARLRGRINRRTREYVNEVLGKLKIYKYRKSKAGVLSGGQKQRVAIARALVNSPGLILADEPTANLDQRTASEIFDIIRDLKRDGKAVLIVTHDSEMHRISDRLYFMEKGRITER